MERLRRVRRGKERKRRKLGVKGGWSKEGGEVKEGEKVSFYR